MPTRNAINTRLAPDIIETVWSGLLVTDGGSWVSLEKFCRATYHVFGTFGGATVTLQGSNETTPANPFALTDQAGAALSFTATGGRPSIPAPRWVRPFVTGGDGTTSLTVIAVTRR